MLELLLSRIHFYTYFCKQTKVSLRLTSVDCSFCLIFGGPALDSLVHSTYTWNDILRVQTRRVPQTIVFRYREIGGDCEQNIIKNSVVPT
jgi:hypothetical protein